MDEWNNTYRELLEQLQRRHVILADKVADDTAKLMELTTTKESIDSDIAHYQRSIQEGQRAIQQLGQTLESAKRGYSQMLESAKALLDLTRSSVPQQAKLQTSQQALESRLFRQPASNNIPQQTKFEPSPRQHTREDMVKTFQWYDADYYARNTSSGTR